jgi:hypothetical protein
MAYATTDQLYAYLDQLDDTDAAQTALLADILDRATAKVDRYLRTSIGDPAFTFATYPAASTKIVASYGGVMLGIPAHEPGSVTLVEYQSASDPVTWATITDPWEEYPDGQVYRAYGWGYQYGYIPLRYRVTAVYGYGPVPDDIESITLNLAVNIFRSKTKGGFTEIIGNEGGGGMRVVAAFTKDDLQTLDDWAAALRPVAI